MWTGSWLDLSCCAEVHWFLCRVGKVDVSLQNPQQWGAHYARWLFLPSKPIDCSTFSRAGVFPGFSLNNKFKARCTMLLFACDPQHISITWAAEHWNKQEGRAGKLKFRVVACGGQRWHAVSSGGVHINCSHLICWACSLLHTDQHEIPTNILRALAHSPLILWACTAARAPCSLSSWDAGSQISTALSELFQNGVAHLIKSMSRSSLCEMFTFHRLLRPFDFPSLLAFARLRLSGTFATIINLSIIIGAIFSTVCIIIRMSFLGTNCHFFDCNLTHYNCWILLCCLL